MATIAVICATELAAVAALSRSVRRSPVVPANADADGWVTATDGPKPKRRDRNRSLHLAEDVERLRFG